MQHPSSCLQLRLTIVQRLLSEIPWSPALVSYDLPIRCHIDLASFQDPLGISDCSRQKSELVTASNGAHCGGKSHCRKMQMTQRQLQDARLYHRLRRQSLRCCRALTVRTISYRLSSYALHNHSQCRDRPAECCLAHEVIDPYYLLLVIWSPPHLSASWLASSTI